MPSLPWRVAVAAAWTDVLLSSAKGTNASPTHTCSVQLQKIILKLSKDHAKSGDTW